MSIPKKIVAQVLERDHGRCVLNMWGCAGAATTADHRANRGSGGSTILDNPAVLVAACWACNGAKEDAHGAVRRDLIERGLRVEKDSTNQKTLTRCINTPVRFPDGTLWFLTADGRRVESPEPPF